MLLKDDAAAAALDQPGSQRPDEKSSVRTLLATILS
jgi:hypothetical protein